jgi:hypothetical protein
MFYFTAKVYNINILYMRTEDSVDYTLFLFFILYLPSKVVYTYKYFHVLILGKFIMVHQMIISFFKIGYIACSSEPLML